MEKIAAVLAKKKDFGICGKHIANDAIHVGIYWIYDGDQQVIHFINGNKIPVQKLDTYFDDYMFNSITDFKIDLVPTISAISELISDNKLNGLIFNKEDVIYNGGKFEFNFGNYDVINQIDRIVNCGVFVTALLNTVDYILLDWDSWPNSNIPSIADPKNIPDYLQDWLEDKKIDEKEWILYYNQSKEIRGKHIIVCPNTLAKPSPYNEANLMADELINNILST